MSCETFTCLYGFPSHSHRRELTSDLKLLADAVIAQGVNHIIWHGMPFNPDGGTNTFFATVHVGPDAAFAPELPAFNHYLTQLCSWMRIGKAYSQLAVYLPWEDALMRDVLPDALRSPAAHHYWEMRHDRIPARDGGLPPLVDLGRTLEESDLGW